MSDKTTERAVISADQQRRAIWLAAFGALILGLPYLWNSTAYAAVTSIAVTGVYVAYVLPTFLRLRLGSAFQRGPWHLGRWSRPIGIIACVWVVFITVVAVIGFAGICWLVAARNWFTGPKVQGTPEELAAAEAELEALA